MISARGLLGGDRPSAPYFERKVEQTLSDEARSLGAIGTYICGLEDDDPLVWSRECAELFELTSVSAPQVRCYFERVHRDDIVALRRARREALARDCSYDVRFRICLPSGKVCWVHERGAAVELERGQRFVGVLQDITEQQETELALRASLSSAEDQLRHAQRLESLGRLASGIAHDFNDLLAVILGAAELALSSVDAGGAAREDLEEIHRAGTRGTLLTRQLLEFSYRRMTQACILDVGPLLEGMQGLLQRVLGDSVVLQTTTPDTTLFVRADPGMLEQVIMNLAINALDAMPAGGSLNIEVHEGIGPLGGADKVCIEVTDTGSGMDEATQARIFEPFFTTKEVGRGTGLGLSTVLGIVQQCGGSVSVDSVVGRGSSFTISLPRIEADVGVGA